MHPREHDEDHDLHSRAGKPQGLQRGDRGCQRANLKDSNLLLGVYAGEKLTVDQLLHGMMMVSGNDRALLLAIRVAGSVAAFSDLANAKAAELGMVNSHFLNATGAYRSGQYSTARDMAILTAYALKNEKFRELIATKTYTIEPNEYRKKPEVIENSNRLISDDPRRAKRIPTSASAARRAAPRTGKVPRLRGRA